MVRARLLSKTIIPFLLLSLWVSCPRTAVACDQVPAGQTFWIRLLDPVASYSSKRGMPVHGMLIESPKCDGAPVFPIGTPVDGEISSVHRVGMGFRHESAAIEINFDRISPRDSAPIKMKAQVVEVDNAREKVKGGVIRGIRSTDTLQDHATLRLVELPNWD